METNRLVLDKLIAELGKDLDFIKSVFNTYIVNNSSYSGLRENEGSASSISDSYFWRNNADKSIDEYNNNSENIDKQKLRFIDRYPEKNYKPKPDSERYAIELHKVMDFIKDDPDSSINIKKICEAQRLDLEKEKLLGRSVSESETGKNIIIINGKKYRLREGEKGRPLYAMDNIEESYVRAVATSILAETDGESRGAKEILENGGMQVVKNLDKKSVVDLLVDLQILALEGGDNLVDSKDKERVMNDKNNAENIKYNGPQGNANNDGESLVR